MMNVKPFILIVDDVPKNLQVLGSILYDNGYEIAMADDGANALKILEDISPDLILLDIMMPNMDGFEVCSIIKSNPKLKDIPIIFLTAKSEAENIVKAFKSGAADYVTKPFNSEELLSRVQVHIDLKKSKEQLEELNSQLEKKVLERTAELKAANDRLAKLDNAKSYFLGLLSHELNTPITGILGSVDLLKNNLKDEEDLELLDFIVESTKRLRKFAEESMLIMRLRTDKYEMNLLEEDLCKLLAEVVDINKDMINSKKISIKKTVSGDPVKVKLDYGLAKKCIDSILNNAIKYSPEKGEIYINLFVKDNYAVVNIKDSGNGFSDEILQNAFNFFVSDEILHHSTGYGLGLATAELIITAHSGEINLSNTDTGASVELKFPIK